VTVQPEAYSPSWYGSNEVPTKNDVYDKIETLGGGSSFSGAKIYKSTSQSFNSFSTTVSFDSEEFDTDDYHSATYPHRLTISATGYYEIKAHVVMTFTQSSNGASALIQKNGSASVIISNEYENSSWSSGYEQTIELSSIVYCTTGDYLTLDIGVTSGGGTVVATGSQVMFFQIKKL